jgi:glutamate-1-semialdehyde 2,1-aminomutase
VLLGARWCWAIRDPVVEAAAARQAALGDCLQRPAPVMVELAELLVDAHRPCRLGAVPEERHGRDDGLRHHRPRRDRPARDPGRRGVLSRGGALVHAGAGRHHAADRANQGRFAYNDVASLTEAADAAGMISPASS